MRCQVVAWLTNTVGLGEYAQTFSANHIDGECLPDITIRNLCEDMEIASFGHRRKIYLAMRGQTSLRVCDPAVAARYADMIPSGPGPGEVDFTAKPAAAGLGGAGQAGVAAGKPAAAGFGAAAGGGFGAKPAATGGFTSLAGGGLGAAAAKPAAAAGGFGGGFGAKPAAGGFGAAAKPGGFAGGFGAK